MGLTGVTLWSFVYGLTPSGPRTLKAEKNTFLLIRYLDNFLSLNQTQKNDDLNIEAQLKSRTQSGDRERERFLQIES
jgi:hypothetical protein